MKVTRVYADESGDSHFGELQVELKDAGEIGRLSEPIRARSVIFRENDPGHGVATDSPGFTTDEPAERLGSRLMLPAQLEPHRAEIERILPPVRLPELAAGSPLPRGARQ